MNVVKPWQERRKLNGNPSLRVATPAPPPAATATPVPQRVTRMKSRG
jgi:hypothetical protein